MEFKELYTVKEVSKILQTNTNYVYELIHTGFLPALKLGSYKIRHRALIEFLDRSEGLDLTDPHSTSNISQRHTL